MVEAKLKINSIIHLLQDLQKINHPSKRDKKTALRHLFAKRKVQDVDMIMASDQKPFMRDTRCSIRRFEESDKITSFVDDIYLEPDCEVHKRSFKTSHFAEVHRIPEVIYEEVNLNKDQIKPSFSDKEIISAPKEPLYEVINDKKKEEEIQISTPPKSPPS